MQNGSAVKQTTYKSRQDRNDDGSECSAFGEERRAVGGNPLRGRTRQRAPAGKTPGAKNDHAISAGEATRTLHQHRRQGLTTRAGRHLRRRRGSKRHRLKWRVLWGSCISTVTLPGSVMVLTSARKSAVVLRRWFGARED
ncbi:hypothetical protein HPB50_015299 [Hyalomma asiaticum]|uniref:Uncharacterized protein n=1 Tax=Hyalomma asiaticum TaxID=266040 RepID=A0ACB7RWV1_HYAAI|nr:hypothetical protein HPB50_015299 [Hyalomma asiaticum]